MARLALLLLNLPSFPGLLLSRLLLNLAAFPRLLLLLNPGILSPRISLRPLLFLLLHLSAFPLLLLLLNPGIFPAGISLRLLLPASALLRLSPAIVSPRPFRLCGILPLAALWRRILLRRYPRLLTVVSSVRRRLLIHAARIARILGIPTRIKTRTINFKTFAIVLAGQPFSGPAAVVDDVDAIDPHVPAAFYESDVDTVVDHPVIL